MTDPIEISPVSKPIRGRIRPPGSKSITNRAFLCAALADGHSSLNGVLQSEDTRVMIEALKELGFGIDEHRVKNQPIDTYKVHGTAGRIPAIEADLFCANSGTTLRFLTALATLGHGSFRLDGVPRMRERPIADLIDALNQLGGRVSSELDNGCPPIVVHANGLPGGSAVVRGDISSQFLSGLLMAAPAAKSRVEIALDGPLVSQPYVRMTLAVMRAFGVEVETAQDLSRFEIAPQSYIACDYEIEPDASAASYFWAAAAVTGGEVTVGGLSRASLQGDVAFVDCLERMGCDVRYGANSITVIGRELHGIEADLNAISDTMQTLAVVSLFAKGATTIRNVAHIRHKETDRIAAVASEARKLGATVVEHDDGLTIEPAELQRATIETYNDHRMAMSFALAGLRIPNVRIANPICVEKTYPDFFRDLADLINGRE